MNINLALKLELISIANPPRPNTDYRQTRIIFDLQAHKSANTAKGLEPFYEANVIFKNEPHWTIPNISTIIYRIPDKIAKIENVTFVFVLKIGVIITKTNNRNAGREEAH